MNFVKIVAIVVILTSVPGCVSTRNGVPVTKQEPDAALQDHIQLGLGYIGEGNRESARFHLQKALEISPRSPGVHNGLALLYQLELEPDRAETEFRKALSLDPGFSRARNNYGVFLYQNERYEEAYDQFLKVSRDISYDLRAQACVSLGLVAQKLGRTQDAEEAYQKALALNGRFAVAYLALANIYFDQKKYPEAKTMLSRYDSLSRPSAQSLWLAVRLENIFGDVDAEESRGLALKKMFPYSQENLDYQDWLKNERNR